MIPVHNHSEYSALDGYSKPEEIAARILEVGAPGAFLTDHGTVAGFPEFRKAMEREGLKVGYGMEAYQARGSRLIKKNAETDKSYRKGEDAFHLVLLAMTNEGYRNLLRISDKAHRTGFHYDPRVDAELLAQYSEGIVATTACIGSLVNQRLMEDDLGPFDDLIGIFGDNLLVEVHTYDSKLQRALNEELARLAAERGLRLVYANDAHYAVPEQYDIHEVLLCAQMNEKFGNLRYAHFLDENGEQRHHPPCLYIMDEAEVRERLADGYRPGQGGLTPGQIDEAIATSDWLMESNAVSLGEKSNQVYLPKVSEKGRGADDLLLDLIESGLARRYPGGKLTREIVDRAEEEYDTLCGAIGGMGADYFLVVHDYITWAKAQGILVGPGRGSVGGSLVAYLIGLTNVDPLKHDLQFQRFWNVGRTDGLPDVDTDFQKTRRHDMIEYVQGKYGDDKVLMIGSHVYLAPKAAVRKAATVVYDDPPYGLVNKITHDIMKKTDTVRAGQLLTWEELFEKDPESFLDEKGAAILRDAREELAPYLADEQWQPMFDAAEGLSGRLSTYGVHASAVVISEVPLDEHLPARSASDSDIAKDRVMVTQAEMDVVEKAGFPKFDFLGLKTLDMLMRAAKLANPGWTDQDAVEYYWSLDVEDPETVSEEYYELIDKGQTLGLFQIDDKYGAKKIGRDLKPRTLAHLGAIVALNNPGPQRTGVVDAYLACRNGEADPQERDAILAPILTDTYGEFVYQEQVIAYFTELYKRSHPRGFDEDDKDLQKAILSEADHIRKMVGKRLFRDMAAYLPVYVAIATDGDIHRCMEKYGDEVDPRDREEIIKDFEKAGYTGARMHEDDALANWDDIVAFSLYGFNKAHAIEYGTVLAWTLHAKGKWPTEFGMAGIEYADKPEKVAGYVNESRARGVAVLPPDVNRSEEVISKAGDGEIIYGLADVKGVGVASARWVVQNRPYASPEAFVQKLKLQDKPACNMGHFKVLMEAGAFDPFGHRLRECDFDSCAGTGRAVRMVPKKSGDGEKRERYECPECGGVGWVPCDLPTEGKRAAAEKALLGVELTNSYEKLMKKHAKRLGKLPPLSTVEDKEFPKGETTITVAGVITDVRDIVIRSDAHARVAGRKMARATIQWEGEELSFAVFPDTLENYEYLVQENTLGEFTLKQSPKGPSLVKGWKAL